MSLSLIIGLTITIFTFSLGLGVFLVPSFRKMLFPELSISRVSDQIPFLSIDKDNVSMITKDNTISRVLVVKGLDYSIKTQDELKSLLHGRINWLDHLASMNIEFKIITIRDNVSSLLEAEYDNKILAGLHKAWMKNFDVGFVNHHYIILDYVQSNSFLDRYIGSIYSGNKSKAKMQEAIEATEDMLADYEVFLLKSEPREGKGKNSDLFSFWARLINGKPVNICHKQTDISRHLSFSVVEFDENEGVITYIDGDERQYAAILSLNSWGDESSVNMMDSIQSLSGRMVILHNLGGIAKPLATNSMEYTKKQAQMLFANENTGFEFDEALELVKSGEASWYKYQMSIVLQGGTLHEIQMLLKDVKRIMEWYGIKPVVETTAMERIWFTQFPDNYNLVRATKPLSVNVASLIDFNYEPKGLSKCDWGQGPLRYYKTATGSPYAFQVHVHEKPLAAACTVTIAPIGAGKTTFWSHNITGALRHLDLHAFALDRYNGLQIVTESTGNAYADLSSNSGFQINPLVCTDTTRNRDFLHSFLLDLSGCSDNESHDVVSVAIDLIFQTDVENRILSNVFHECFPKGSLVKAGLQRWVEGGGLSHWFNGSKKTIGGKIIAHDALDITSAKRLVTFEMTDILRNQQVAGAMADYLLYRIQSFARDTASPSIIFIDETAPIIAEASFAEKVKILLQEFRKLRGSVNLCFQLVKDIMNSPIRDAIVSQCMTRCFFPSPSDDIENYDIFKLTSSEKAFIMGDSRAAKNLKHAVLIKREDESVILDADLKPLGNKLHLYTSGSAPVKIMREMQEQWGHEDWVEHYLGVV
jgi:type IV secretion/conjugal transfer VirB4 family ATPase